MIAIDAYVVTMLSWALIVAGSFFYVTGAIGLLRMPDVFTRMHASSVAETMGGALLIIGMMLQAGFTLNTGRLAVILVLLLFIGPVATHALARAAQFAGVKPQLAHDRTRPAPRKRPGPGSPAATKPASKAAAEPRRAAARSALRARAPRKRQARGGAPSKR